MYHFLCITAMVLGVSSMAALPTKAGEGLTEGEVRMAVETWVRYVTVDARPDAAVDRLEPYVDDGALVGYIAHLQGGGFCLAGASPLLLPVYLYSPAGTYDPTNPGYRYILWEMAERLRYLAAAQAQGYADPEAYRTDLARRVTLWQDLISGRIPLKIEEIQVTPALMELGLTSHWGQRSPYNDRCPNLTPGHDEHAVTGCVATAIAQVMTYWQWPSQGTGSGSIEYDWRFRNDWDATVLATNPNLNISPISSFWGRLRWTSLDGGRLEMTGYWDDTVYEEARTFSSSPAYQSALETLWNRLDRRTTSVTADFGLHNYYWGLMQDVHYDPVDQGDVEVADLMSHVGVAVGMDYGLFSSSASTSDGEHALQEHFGYDPDVEYHDGPNPETMVREIQWLRPLVLRAHNQQDEGHAWVVLGYNTEVYPWQFRMNFGWDGGSDGWYSLDRVPVGLVEDRGYLIEIAPRNAVRFVGASSAGDGSPNDPYRNIEEAIGEAPSGSTLVFRASSDNTFSSTLLTIDRPLILKGKDTVIRRQ